MRPLYFRHACSAISVSRSLGHDGYRCLINGPAEWIDTKISFELDQDGDYCIVLFKHQDWKAPVEFMHHCSTKWATFLMSLKSLVETGKGAPNPDDIKIGNWN